MLVPAKAIAVQTAVEPPFGGRIAAFAASVVSEHNSSEAAVVAAAGDAAVAAAGVVVVAVVAASYEIVVAFEACQETGRKCGDQCSESLQEMA